MNLRAVLRVSIVFQWGFILAVVPLALSQQTQLPLELKTWQVAQANRPVDLAASISILNLLIGLVASVGVCFLKRWAAWLYLFSTIVSLSFELRGPRVQGAIDSFGSEITSILAGVVIGVAFFTDVTRKGSRQLGELPT